MDKQLIPHKDTFFNKIRLFFRKIFKKNTTEKNTTQKVEDEKINISAENKNHFEQIIKINENDLKPDIQNMKMEDFINNLEKHPEWLKSLSTDRLLTLKGYVNKELKEYNEKINNLKKVS